MTIYEIDSQILDCIDEETGEVLDIERLEKLMQDKENKIEAVALWYKNTVAEADAIKAEIANLRARKEHDEKLAENLKIYLSNVLDGEKFKTPKVSISYITSIPTTISEIYPDLKFFQTKNRRFKKNIRPFCTVSCNFGRKISYL